MWLEAQLGIGVGHKQVQLSSGPGLSKNKAKNWDRLSRFSTGGDFALPQGTLGDVSEH